MSQITNHSVVLLINEHCRFFQTLSQAELLYQIFEETFGCAPLKPVHRDQITTELIPRERRYLSHIWVLNRYPNHHPNIRVEILPQRLQTPLNQINRKLILLLTLIILLARHQIQLRLQLLLPHKRLYHYCSQLVFFCQNLDFECLA